MGCGLVTNAAPATSPASAPFAASAYRYKIDVSKDSTTFTTALDQSANTTARNTIFEEIRPTKCRFVRLTMTDWARTTPLGIIESAVFGKAAESLPPAQPIPRAR